MDSAAKAIVALGQRAYELHQQSGQFALERRRLNNAVQQLVALVKDGRQRLQAPDVAPLRHELVQATDLMGAMARDERRGWGGLGCCSRPVSVVKKAGYVAQCTELVGQLERRLAGLSQVLQSKAALKALYPRADEATAELWEEVRRDVPRDSVIRRCAAEGAELDKVWGIAGTCAHHCAANGKATTILALHAAGADVDAHNIDWEQWGDARAAKPTGGTPLHFAARNGDTAAAYTLIVQCGADPERRATGYGGGGAGLGGRWVAAADVARRHGHAPCAKLIDEAAQRAAARRRREEGAGGGGRGGAAAALRDAAGDIVRDGVLDAAGVEAPGAA